MHVKVTWHGQSKRNSRGIILLLKRRGLSCRFWSRSLRPSFLSPGRIVLIGEQGPTVGTFSTAAIPTQGTARAARKRDEQVTIFLLSQLWGQRGIIRSASCWPQKFERHSWTNYPKGVLRFFWLDMYVIDKGLSFYVCRISQIVQESLSSSASLELFDWCCGEYLFDLKQTVWIWLKSTSRK